VVTLTWRLATLLGLLGFVAGGALGWRLAGAPPPVERRVEERIVYRDRTTTNTVAGPVRIQTRTVTVQVPVTTSTGTVLYVPRTETVVNEVRGEIKTFTFRDTNEKLSFKVYEMPKPPPTWSVDWRPRLLPTQDLVGTLAVGYRAIGPAWVEVWVSPLAPSAGVGLRVEF
jgi:hypothetical protein